MNKWDVNICAATEHCVEWRDTVLHLVIKDIGRKYNPRGMWTVAASNHSVGNHLKPGGALLYSTEDMAICTIQKGVDPWGHGRWAFQQYRSKDGHSVLVISGYRVDRRSNIPGSSTVWYQQKVLLTTQGRIEEDPADAFLTDMLEWINTQTAQSEKMEIILFLDANEQWSLTANITQFADLHALENINIAGDFKFPPLHPSFHNMERSTTIDYCLCTSGVLPRIQYATMAPYDLAILGDHRGMILDIDLNELLKDRVKLCKDKNKRNLITSNVQSCKKYIDLVETGFGKQNIIHKMDKLYHQWTKKI